MTVRETIKQITFTHLKSNLGKCYGQCLTAVGWVGGTLPEMYEEDGMVELSMADVAGGAIVTGASLAGDRPIYVVRYQGFQWYNCISIVNYAAKSKELWGRSCPVFVRSIAMEGGIGPVAGSSHHSLVHRMPGIKIASPMTSIEYKEVYKCFMEDDVPYYVSEHRKSYDNDVEFNNVAENEKPDFSIFPISITRFEMESLYEMAKSLNITLNIFHILWIKPFNIEEQWIESLKNSKYGGLVIDDDFVEGTASSLANQLSLKANNRVYTLGLDEKTAGFPKEFDNLPPNSEKILFLLKKIKSDRDE
jgi:pyruvate/2-oxoglutarate/acetoin dehydrogenase E1 component